VGTAPVEDGCVLCGSTNPGGVITYGFCGVDTTVVIVLTLNALSHFNPDVTIRSSNDADAIIVVRTTTFCIQRVAVGFSRSGAVIVNTTLNTYRVIPVRGAGGFFRGGAVTVVSTLNASMIGCASRITWETAMAVFSTPNAFVIKGVAAWFLGCGAVPLNQTLDTSVAIISVEYIILNM